VTPRASRLALDETFMNATFRAHQIVRLHGFASTELDITLSARDVARPFNVSHSAVTRAKLRGYEDPPARGRHHEFSPNCEAEIVEWLTKKAANNTAVNRIKLLNECIERFGKSITRG
jgi:transposase